MAAELRRCGAVVEEGPTTSSPSRRRSIGAPPAIETYDDHRMAMCLSLAAFNGARGAGAMPVRILEPRCVGKTFPDFFETLFQVAEAVPAHVPVITVDGPTASGKGTLASAVAAALGYHLLDSGSLYRATALAALPRGVDPEDEAALGALAARLELRFHGCPNRPRRHRCHRRPCARRRSAYGLAHLGMARGAPRRCESFSYLSVDCLASLPTVATWAR